MSEETPPRRSKQIGLHLLRVLLFASVIGLIHRSHSERTALASLTPAEPVTIQALRALFPEADALDEELDQRGMREVFDASGELLGSFIRTSPAADGVIGFCGPTDTLLAFDTEERVLGVEILSSDDTRDHIAEIREDANFLSHLRGLSWTEVSLDQEVDGVTGATLSSIAIQEGLRLRLGGGATSLRFREPITMLDVRALFPSAVRLEALEENPSRSSVQDSGGVTLGSLLRTSPASDALVGYQGPSDTLIAFGLDERFIGLRLLQTYDNEEYASYLREDDYYPTQFTGLSMAELSALDWSSAGVDGVSGATLISNSVTEGMILAAKRASTPREPWLKWETRDLGTALVLLFGIVIGMSSLRSNERLRTVFLCVLVGYLGLVNGDMLSQALLVGWAQHGVPWRSAGGLVLLTFAALIIPITTKRNLYCSHLCPHGALQQLLKKRLPWQTEVPKRLVRILRLLPFALLSLCVIVPMTDAAFSLVDIEPFDAWVYSIAGWPTITVAVVGLAASLFIPMAYCKYGCPTGALLEFLRFHAKSDVWSKRDWAALALLGFAACLMI